MTRRFKITASIVLVLAVLLFSAWRWGTISIGPDFVIPSPPPREALFAWTPDTHRATIHTTISGAELRGFRYDGVDPTEPTILFFYGNGSTALGMDPYLRDLSVRGPSILVYDFRGYGFSAGKAHLATFCEDALQLYDDAVKTTPGGRVVVFGASMGTTVASYVAAHRNVAGLILGMPIASAAEEGPIYLQQAEVPPAIASHVVPSKDATLLFGEAAELKNYTGPLLILVGTRDTLVPMKQGHEILAASDSLSKQIVEVPGADHNEVIDSGLGMNAVAALLHSLAAPTNIPR